MRCLPAAEGGIRVTMTRDWRKEEIHGRAALVRDPAAPPVRASVELPDRGTFGVTATQHLLSC